MQPLVDNRALDASRVTVSVRGTLLMCTSEEIEGVRLRQLNLLQRTRCLGKDSAKIEEMEVNFPYVERYVIFEAICDREPIELSSDGCSDKRTYEAAMLHAYSSFDEYKRRRNSARKKDRLRVDRLVDSLSSVDSSCEFHVDALDGKRVVKTWYFRAPNLEVKEIWLKQLNMICG
ncbi:hypothetical protein ACHAXS_009908 [Conticribra weissflogii]